MEEYVNKRMIGSGTDDCFDLKIQEMQEEIVIFWGSRLSPTPCNKTDRCTEGFLA